MNAPNHASLTEADHERATSFDAEDGPFADTFAIYANEARADSAEIDKAKARWTR